MTRRTVTAALAVVVTAAVVLSGSGCGDGMRDDGAQPSLARVALPEMETRTRQYAVDLVAAFAALPAATRLGPVPCEEPGGDLADDGRYHVSGSWQLPLPPDRQRATFQQLRDAWQARGIEVTEYRELSDGVKVSMAGRDPAAGFSVTLTSTQPPDAVALLVASSCVSSPDGKYPG